MTTTNNKRDFSQGKIYRIEPVCEFDEGDIYIGSTTQDLLCKRFRNHRGGYNTFKNGIGNRCMSYVLFDKYGMDRCKILLIENVNASSLDEVKSREAYYIRTLKCVNKCIPLRTRTEYKKDNEQKTKENSKDYYEGNKEKIKKYKQQYNVVNEEKVKEYQTNYRQSNKEKTKEYNKQYNEVNEEIIKEKK